MNYKIKLPLLLTLLYVAPQFASADSGLYAGIGAGYGTINTSTTNGFNYVDGASNKNNGNMLGSIYVGYDFSRYLGVQVDYNYIANTQYTTGTDAATGAQGSFSASQQLVDLGITGHLPFELLANSLSGISLFGKAAIGYNTVNFNGGTVRTSTGYQQNLPGTAQSMVPVIGGGVEYGISSVGIRLEYDYIGNTSVNVNNQNLMNVNNNIYLISALYHF
ncbi:MAG: outer membrane beta-barrel protein [Burkholderiales bacterium]|nr:outer membrane beta-barrel protein [Burkholderiales bacterium]